MQSDFLASLRYETDPLADNAVKGLIDNNLLEISNRTLFGINQNQYDSSSFPPPLREYLHQSGQLPGWVDWNKVAKAQDLYALYGLEIAMLLLFKSLPQSYCCPKGVKVLHATGRLSKDPGFNKFSRRIIETSQFVINVLNKNSFQNEGNAIITSQKVRLIHSSIRFYLKKYGWNSETNGEPINHEDQLGTLMSFSALIIEGLEQLNIHWTEEEKDAFIHIWNIAGYLLGLREELLPKNYQEAIKTGYAIFDDQKGYSEEGKELSDALVSFIHYILPGNMFDGIAETLIAYFLGKDKIEYIGLKTDESFIEKRLPHIMRIIYGTGSELKEHSHIVQAIIKPFSKLILQGILSSYNDHKGPAILIPPSLTENWQLHTEWQTRTASPEILGLRLAIQKKINKFG